MKNLNKLIKKYIKKYKNLKKILKFKKKKNYFKKINKIKKIIDLYKEYKKNKNLLKETKKLKYIEEIKILVKEDLIKYKKISNNIKKNLKNLIKKNKKKKEILLEIKSGIGGDESTIFVNDIYKMYIKYFEKKKIKFEILNLNKTNLGGYKNILILIKDKNIFKNLKFETGVHRVQRLPSTENNGRIHTSTCKVYVSKNIKLKLNLNKNDFKIENFKSSGSGGQHVNKTNSAIRIKHIPSGIIAECQEERSQNDNKKKAMNIIKYKIYLKNLEKNFKKNFLKGKRSEKIRTYNYQKNLLIDHRINLKLYNLNNIMQGNLEELVLLLKKKL